MKRIKKFESFSNHRMPEEVTYDQWLNKYDIHGLEPFNQKEIEFFNKLGKENRLEIESYSITEQKISIMMIIEDHDISTDTVIYKDIVEIELRKLKDDWYLICKNYNQSRTNEEYFIGDEWDEVLGYLESINLKL